METGTTNNQIPAVVVSDHTGYTRLAEMASEFEIRRGGEHLCDLSHLGYAAATGEDAGAFLQGQLTNDLSILDEGESQLSGYCTNKGRLVSLFRIHRDGSDFVMQTGANWLPAVLEKMRRYVLRSRVELACREDITGFGVFGKECSSTLARLIGDLPDDVGGVVCVAGITVVRHPPAAAERYQVIGPAVELKAARTELSGRWPQTGSWAWASADVRQGIPTVFERTAEEFLPHSLNLDILGAVNFRKGCYPGQEIVARMQYRGKPKSRMILARVESERPPVPGDKLYAQGKEQSIGMLVDVAPAERGCDVLTTAKLEYLEEGELVLGDPAGAAVSRSSLPYAVTG